LFILFVYINLGIVSGLVLGEKVNTRWYIGATVIAVGVCLIALSQHSKRTE
jgi:drug/metabolite transporter (DMT)-like permease